MAMIESLLHTNELKTDLFNKLPQSRGLTDISIRYYHEFDALIMLIVPFDVETVVHYVDEHVALLYIADTYEIVGIQIEDWEHSFLPAHDNVKRVWKLSDSVDKDTIENLFELSLTVEKRKTHLAREVVRASADRHGLEEFPLAEELFKVPA